MDTKSVDLQSKVLGSLLGLACGDALGAPAEFLSREKLRQQHGHLTEMVGNHLWNPGEWTDDTSMTLAVAEGILADPANPIGEIGQRFLKWLASRPKDVGSTIADAFGQYRILQAHGKTGNLWPRAAQATAGARTGRAAGNGSLMRTLPIALAYSDTAIMLLQSARISAMTHWDAQAEVCCAVYCLWIQRLLQGDGRLTGWKTALQEAREVSLQGNLAPEETPGSGPLPPGFWERLERIPDLREESLQPSGYAGYVLECLEAAVWWVLHASSYEEAIVGTVNLAGEADTIAAVAGGAAGAYWTIEAIPVRWLEKLEQRQRVEEVASQLVHLRHSG